MDLFAVIAMGFSGQSTTAHPDREIGGVDTFPFLLVVPTLIRMRQCFTEYMRVRGGLRDGSLERSKSGWGGQHLANLFKYFTAIPVVVLSVMQLAEDSSSSVGMSSSTVFRLW